MATLQKKLTNLIQSRLGEARAELETLPNGNVCGHVISPDFDGQTYETRRLRLRRLFAEAVQSGDLTPQEHQNISTLLTYTPEEWTVQL